MDSNDNGHVEKLAEVGKQTLNLFHEMNNNFSVMVGMLDMINIRYTEIPGDIDPTLKQCLDKLHVYILRSVELVDNTLGRSRNEKKQVALCEINEIIRDTIRNLAQHSGFRGVSFYSNLEDSFRETIINTLEFEHILMNLFNNARDSILMKGDRGSVFVRTYTTDGNIVIEVADTGEGIAQEIRERIFYPFFTTKGKGPDGGTGLGLAVSYGLIRNAGGDIAVESELHKGSTFLVSLPACKI